MQNLKGSLLRAMSARSGFVVQRVSLSHFLVAFSSASLTFCNEVADWNEPISLLLVHRSRQNLEFGWGITALLHLPVKLQAYNGHFRDLAESSIFSITDCDAEYLDEYTSSLGSCWHISTRSWGISLRPHLDVEVLNV